MIARWIIASVVGLGGTRLINVAIPWFVLTTTRDPALAGAVGLAQMAPLVVCKALAGPIIDRVGAIRVAVAADLLSCAAVAAVPVLHATGHLSLPILYAVVSLEGALRGPADAAKYSLCPRIAAVSAQPLERITGYANTIDRLAGALGAAAGGVVVAAIGAPRALLVSCATFTLAAVLVRVWLGPTLGTPSHSLHRARAGGRAYWDDLAEGWRFLRTDSVLVAITVMVALTNLLDQAYLIVMVPAWALGSGRGADTVGMVLATFTGAAVVGSLISSQIGERLPRLPTYVVAFVLAGLPRFFALALDLPLPALLAVLVVGGLASGFINPILGAVIFGRIPEPLVGRVSALNTAFAWALMPFGGLVGGVLIARTGVSPALLACGAAYLVITLAPTVLPAWRHLAESNSLTSAAK